MMIPKLTAAVVLSSLVAASAGQGAAEAADYPVKPVRVIVPAPPVGGFDAIARIVAQRLEEGFGRRFYVENMPGAGTTLGTAAAAAAPADGYTILFVNQDLIVQPVVKTGLTFDPFKSFAPVTLVAIAPEMIAVNPSVPAKTMRELIDLAKASPGKYTFASPGFGSSPHLAGEWLYRITLGLDVVHVPFKGAEAVAATAGGHTQIVDISVPSLVPFVKDGRLHGIAVASKHRSAALPDVPTLEESGIPGHETEFMVGVVVPAGTPAEIVKLLHQRIVQILAMPDVKERLGALGFEPVGDTPEEFAAKLEADYARWKSVVRQANIKID